MFIRTEEERKEAIKNKRNALIVTVLFQGLVAILAFYIVAWTPPDPPIPQYGIEVNFGLDEAGFGEKQPTKPVNTSSQPSKAVSSPTKVTENPVPKVEPIATPPAYREEATPVEPVAPAGEETVVANPSSSKNKAVDKPKEPAVVAKPKETSTPATTETTLTGNEGQKKDADKNADSGSHGNVAGSTGDQGNKEGSINAELLIPDASGRGAIGLDMKGWKWSTLPQPDDTSSESGQIVFEIKINRYGEIVAIKTLFRSVSRMVADIYQKALKEATFEPNEGVNPDETTTGKVTFNIKVR